MPLQGSDSSGPKVFDHLLQKVMLALDIKKPARPIGGALIQLVQAISGIQTESIRSR